MYGFLRYTRSQENGRDKYITYLCRSCGKEETNCYTADIRDRMAERMMCFNCSYYEDYIQGIYKTPPVIIDGRMMAPGNRTSGSFRGCAGRRFDIEFISGPYAGKKITTYDLWMGGKFPEHLRHKFPDTAKFLDGASEVKVGDTTCFNQSSGKTEPYPLPRTIGIL